MRNQYSKQSVYQSTQHIVEQDQEKKALDLAIGSTRNMSQLWYDSLRESRQDIRRQSFYSITKTNDLHMRRQSEYSFDDRGKIKIPEYSITVKPEFNAKEDSNLSR